MSDILPATLEECVSVWVSHSSGEIDSFAACKVGNTATSFYRDLRRYHIPKALLEFRQWVGEKATYLGNETGRGLLKQYFMIYSPPYPFQREFIFNVRQIFPETSDQAKLQAVAALSELTTI